MLGRFGRGQYNKGRVNEGECRETGQKIPWGRVTRAFKANFENLPFSTGEVRGRADRPHRLSPLSLSVQT